MRIVLGLITIVFCLHPSFAGCPAESIFSDSTLAGKVRKLKAVAPETIDDNCLTSIIDSFKHESTPSLFHQFIKFIEDRSAARGLSLSLLTHCADIPYVTRDRETGKRLIALWERRNKPLAQSIQQYLNGGRQAEIDSLFRVFDRCIGLSPDQVLMWAGLKEIGNAYGAVLDLYCRVIAMDRIFMRSVFDRCSSLLENAPQDTIRSALVAFERCAYAIEGIDTAMVLQWIAGVYAQHDLTQDEIRILERLPKTSGSIIARFLEIASIQYRKGSHGEAIQAARAAYERAPGAHSKKEAAFIICRSFERIGRLDSAIAWLDLSDYSTEEGMIEAVVLYQKAGKMNDAQAMIGKLPQSYVRDTLAIRQLLYRGDTAAAFAAAEDIGKRWTGYPEAVLWKVRCLSFCGRVDAVGALIDTLSINPSWMASRELLDYRYYWNVLSRSAEGEAVWSRIEYDLYIGRSTHAVEIIGNSSLPDDVRTVVVLRVLGGLKAAGEIALLERMFLSYGSLASDPEVLYLYAEMLASSQRNKAKAEELLFKIINDFPATIFAEKARIMLSQLRGNS
jgi:hypothetical protein